MARALVAGGALQGQERDAVRTLLGDPDADHATGTWYYQVDVGMTFGSSPWMYYVIVHFSDAGTVDGVRLDD